MPIAPIVVSVPDTPLAGLWVDLSTMYRLLVLFCFGLIPGPLTVLSLFWFVSVVGYLQPGPLCGLVGCFHSFLMIFYLSIAPRRYSYV